MPDLCMCDNPNCLVKEYCYRHTAKPSEYRQSYFADYTDDIDTTKECEYFMENERYESDSKRL